MSEIIRDQTEQEKADFESLYKEDPMNKFRKLLGEKEQECIKKGLPFAKQVAMIEFNEQIQSQIKISKNKYDKVRREDIKLPELDLDKYCDLKNFEVIAKEPMRDNYLSKEYKQPIYINTVKYKFKGFHYTYTVQEDKDSAIQRALNPQKTTK